MAKFKVILERIDTLTKQAEITVEAIRLREHCSRLLTTWLIQAHMTAICSQYRTAWGK